MTARPALWTEAEAAAATGGRTRGKWRATGVAIDSRAVAPGDLFIAIRGANRDGHAFVADALGRGAAAAMVAQVPDGIAQDAGLLVVDDTLDGLGALARSARRRITGKAIAVTGSVGKTGTKEALRHVLSAQAPTSATTGNLNNLYGVPLSLARLAHGTTFGVFEVGMNHAGEITPLSQMIGPDIGIITKIAPAHMEFFASLDEVADAKAELFAGMGAGGVAVLNRDDPYFDRLAASARARGIGRIIGFGADARAEVRLIDASAGAEETLFSAEVAGTAVSCRIGLPGRHWLANALGVLAVVHAAGADVAAAAAALADMPALAGRGRRETVALAGGEFVLIDESYNANPASMAAAIETLGGVRPAPGGRRIAVLGEMFELGPEAQDHHTALAGQLAGCGIDIVFAAGPMMAPMIAALPRTMRGGHAENAEALAALLPRAVRPGDVVMVKGSLSSGMKLVVAALGRIGGGQPRAVNG